MEQRSLNVRFPSPYEGEGLRVRVAAADWLPSFAATTK